MKNSTWLTDRGPLPALLLLPAQRRPLDRLGEQHLLGEDQVRARVVRHLVVVTHGDRVERAAHPAVAAEDAAAEVDLVHGGVPLPAGDSVLAVILSGHDANYI